MDEVHLLFCRDTSNNLEYEPIVSKIPTERLNEANDIVNQLRLQLKKHQEYIKNMRKENDIRRAAAGCEDCNLCMVCAGDHRRYESWPPGSGKCFATMIKKGKPLREDPCTLCEIHDKELRDFKRAWRQSLTKQSSLKSKLNKAIIQRRSLFKEFSIDHKLIME